MSSSQIASTSPVSATVSRALFSTSSALNESPLCFNKAYFSQADFNVDRFVNLARRRANLSQIHNDLRVYLKIVQNSMIELINDDYADFVNLSSGLVGLKDTIDKLAKDMETIWDELCSSTKKFMATAKFVEKQAADLNACRARQIELRSKIAFITAVERLSACISSQPKNFDSLWLNQLIDGVVDLVIWYRRFSKSDQKLVIAYDACIMRTKEICERLLVLDLQEDCRLARLFLGVLTLVDGVDTAVSRVMNDVIDPKIQKNFNDLAVLLEHIFDSMLQMRNLWMTKLEKHGVCSPVMSSFLDKCLLTYVVSVLDQHFGSVLVPSDARLFHRCYSITCSFVANWPESDRSRTVLRMIRDRFKLIVYFKLETHQFISDFGKHSEPADLTIAEKPSSEIGSDFLYCECSRIVINALNTVWSDASYLPSLADKFWDFSLKLLKKYSEWVDAVFKFFGPNNGNVEGTETWRLLCAVCADCSNLDSQVFGLALSSIWSKLRDLNLDTTLFGQCLTMFSTIITRQRKELEKIISEKLISALCKGFDGVADIPRHYRWTKKPSPTKPSQYITDAFNIFESFKTETSSCYWNDEDTSEISRDILSGALDVFCSKAEQVIESVEQTGSSLQRFKRKGAFSGSGEGSTADTDESKIRNQLLLDLTYCRQQAAFLEINTSKLDALMSRAMNTRDEQKGDSAHSLTVISGSTEP